jgi:hypothetical protein
VSNKCSPASSAERKEKRRSHDTGAVGKKLEHVSIRRIQAQTKGDLFQLPKPADEHFFAN